MLVALNWTSQDRYDFWLGNFEKNQLRILNEEVGQVTCRMENKFTMCEALTIFNKKSIVLLIACIAKVILCFDINQATVYSTFTLMPSEWEVNSGAYIHWIVVIPFEKFPLWVTNMGYSKT